MSGSAERKQFVDVTVTGLYVQTGNTLIREPINVGLWFGWDNI